VWVSPHGARVNTHARRGFQRVSVESLPSDVESAEESVEESVEEWRSFLRNAGRLKSSSAVEAAEEPVEESVKEPVEEAAEQPDKEHDKQPDKGPDSSPSPSPRRPPPRPPSVSSSTWQSILYQARRLNSSSDAGPNDEHDTDVESDSTKKSLNVESPSFTPTLPVPAKKAITSQAAAAAPFTPSGLASGT
jgi:hypothetical protein